MYVHQEGTAADLDPVETDLMSFFFFYIFRQSLGSLIYIKKSSRRSPEPMSIQSPPSPNINSWIRV